MTYFFNIFQLFLYIVTMLYFVILGCVMLAHRDNPISTRGELVAKRRMTRSVGVFMLIWALDYLIYLYPMLQSDDVNNVMYDIVFLITLMMVTPALYAVMHAITQKTVNTVRWICSLGMPFLALIVLYLLLPSDGCHNIIMTTAIVFNVLCIAFLVAVYASEYHDYVCRLRSEYSDTSGREIVWAWSCFAGFAAQALIFILYYVCWEPWLDFVYWALCIVNAAYLCFCVSKQKPLDFTIVTEVEEDEAPTETASEKKSDDKVFYAIIEHKLEALCEEKMLFLEPDLTRETLCLRLSIGRTYLSMYLHSRGLTFYQYINTLRVEYAVKLMQENPGMSIREVSELSGFRSQTTFRKMFQEVMGCLPSEVKKGGKL